jgi:cysteinyl-tRNA synthetase
MEMLKSTFNDFVFEILGLKADEQVAAGDESLIEGLMHTILDIRKEAKQKKDWPTADKIRDHLSKLDIEVKDTKEGASWNLKK